MVILTRYAFSVGNSRYSQLWESNYIVGKGHIDSMGTDTALVYCEHGELEVACLDCLAKPQKVVVKPPSAPRATKSPRSGSDKISALTGDYDISVPVADPVDVVGSSLLPARAFPHYLRRSGWVYLRSENSLAARVKVKRVVWTEARLDLEDPTRDLGAGLALSVDSESWEAPLDIDLGDLADRQRAGYRYLKTNSDGSVTHYLGGRPVTETIDLTA